MIADSARTVLPAFRPSLLSSVIFAVFFITFIALALWQWQRAEDKTLLQKKIDRLTHQEVLIINRAEELQGRLHYPVQITGHFLPGYEILLDNIVSNGSPGFHVLTPFLINDSQQLVVVNRGWVAMGKTRQQLPKISTPVGTLTLTGRVAKPRSKAIGLGDMEQPNPENEKLWLYLDVEYLAKQIGRPVVENVILLDESNKDGDSFSRNWPVFDAKIGMHIGYFFHWIAFAIGALVVYLWFSFKTNKEEC